jgi:hypothetical protein
MIETALCRSVFCEADKVDNGLPASQDRARIAFERHMAK